MTDEQVEEIVQDEELDISAVYVLGKGKFDLNSLEIDKAILSAMKEAQRKHKAAGNPVAVSRDGKVVILQPDEIEIG